MATGKSFNSYQVLTKLGEGAASELYSVFDKKTRHVWALKHVIKADEKDQRFLDQVENEFAVGSKLDHPNIRAMERLVRHRRLFKVTSLSLIMELVDGQPLDKRLPRNHLQAVQIFKQVAEGLHHMHTRGYVHADIKPSNVLVSEDAFVKIIDLGQGCPIGTVKKRIQGTPGYMAPEQAHRQAITPQTDIYNFGATMYWTLVRELIPTVLPPKEDNGGSLYSGAIDADMIEPPVPPHVKNPRIHPLLSKQILDCVALHPDDRPASMEIICNRLELIGDLLENPPQPPPLVSDETVF
jgi:serine/threonine-protein kinase